MAADNALTLLTSVQDELRKPGIVTVTHPTTSEERENEGISTSLVGSPTADHQ